MDDLSDDVIDAQIQKELDAISISSLDVVEESEDGIEAESFENINFSRLQFANDKTTLLYLEKSLARNKVAQAILQEADDLLSECNATKQPPKVVNTGEGTENDYEIVHFTLKGNEVIATKTIEEIEDENRMKLEELELHLESDANKQKVQMQQVKDTEEEQMKNWAEKEEKMQKTMKVMIDKAQYWEKTYDEVAQDEIVQREKELQMEYQESQRRITELENEQKKFLENLLNEKRELERKKKTNAVTLIQTIFRGYFARKKYGGAVRQKISEFKERRRQERIAAIEKEKLEEKAKKETERMAALKAKREAQEKAEMKAKMEAEAKAKKAEIKAKKKAEAKARRKAESKAKEEAEMKARLKAEEAKSENHSDTKKAVDEGAEMQTKAVCQNGASSETEVIAISPKESCKDIIWKNDDKKTDTTPNTSLNQDGHNMTEQNTLANIGNGQQAERLCTSTPVNEKTNLEQLKDHEIKQFVIGAEGTVIVSDQSGQENEESRLPSYEIQQESKFITEKIEHDHCDKYAPAVPHGKNVQVSEEKSTPINQNTFTSMPKADVGRTESNNEKPSLNEDHREAEGVTLLPPPHSTHEDSTSLKSNHIAASDSHNTGHTAHIEKSENLLPQTPEKPVGQEKIESSVEKIDSPKVSDFKLAGSNHKNDESCDVETIVTDNVEHAQNELNSESKQASHIESKPSEAQAMSSNSKVSWHKEIANVEASKDISQKINSGVNISIAEGTTTENGTDREKGNALSYVGPVNEQQRTETIVQSQDQVPLQEAHVTSTSKSQSEAKHSSGKEVPSTENFSQQRNKEEVFSSDSNPSVNGRKATKDSNNDLSSFHESYELEIQKQHQAWLERLQANLKCEKTKLSTSVANKRRKIIRSSSAAKRFLPFSVNEIYEGSFTSPTCHFNTRASEDDDVICLFLSYIDGGRNLSSVSSCKNLTYLTVQSCGLISIENLQSCQNLKYVDASCNLVNLISCCGMKSLEYLDLSHNALTSIHGLDGCQNLLFLDLSNNHITKTNGMDDLKSLCHIRLAENQLISLAGLGSCECLLFLDVSENHLNSLDDLEDNKLLMSVVASGNNLESLGEKFLENSVLLLKLHLNRNSLSSLELHKETWLPSITEIQARVNRIGLDSVTMPTNYSLSTPFLSYLDLSKNLIPDLTEIKSLKDSKCLHHVDITDNPLSISNDEDRNFLQQMPEILTQKDKSSDSVEESVKIDFGEKFCPLQYFGKNFVNLLQAGDTFEEENVLETMSKYFHEIQLEVRKHSIEIQRAFLKWSHNEDKSSARQSCPPAVFSIHANHLKKMQEMAFHYRHIHESSGIQFQKSEEFQANELSVEEIKKSMSTNETSKSHETDENFEEKHHFPVSDPVNQKSVLKPDSSQKVAPYPSPPKYPCNQNVRNSAIYEKLNRSFASEVMQNAAIKKIQAFWRGYRVRKRLSLIANAQQSAAIVIQACWRGFLVRQKIKKAMDLLKQRKTPDVLDEEIFEDVDLEGFNFDEETFDEQWAYKVTGFRSKSQDMERKVPHNSPLSDYQHDGESVHLEYAKPVNSEVISIAPTKPPLPPISSRGNTPLDTSLRLNGLDTRENSFAESTRSKTSSKQETLTNEWGIKSSSTADLMMKRARRLKGAKKKTKTAEQKLHRFQEKVSSFQSSELALTKRSQPTNRVEYFKAREQEFCQRDKVPSAEDQQKMKYTYEWIHSQVGSHYDPHHKTSPPKKSSSADASRSRYSGFLPVIPRSPSLVGAPDMEVVSLSNSSTYMERSKDRLRDIAWRHNPNFTGER